MSQSRIHCCYIIIGTEFKGKHILEQDELFCCAIISSGLKEKKNICPFLLLENSRPLSPPLGPRTFLINLLGIDSLTSIWGPVCLDCGGVHGTTHTHKGVHVTPVKSEKEICELYQCQFSVLTWYYIYVKCPSGVFGTQDLSVLLLLQIPENI